MPRLPVDLDELCHALEDHSGQMDWLLDPETGAIWCRAPFGEAVDDDPDELTPEQRDQWYERYERLVRIDPVDSAEAFADMEEFVDALGEGAARAALERALTRAHPFRRFKDELQDWPELRDAWFAHHDARMRDRALEWLRELEIEPDELRGDARGGILPHWLEG